MNEIFTLVNIESKTIANVRTVDECVKRMNGVFSLENTESEYKKGDKVYIKIKCNKIKKTS